MEKKNLLNSLKELMANKPSGKFTDDLKQALDKYIQRNLEVPEEEFSSNEVLSFETAVLPEASFFSEKPSFTKERADDIETVSKPSQTLPNADHGPYGSSYMKKAKKDSNVSYAIGSFKPEQSLEEHLRNLDSSFSESLLKLIDKKGMTDSECYRRSGIDRRLFSKMRNNDYHPSKNTVLALCIGLSLSKNEAVALLEKAGYTLSKSSVQDLIVEYFLVHRQWDIDLVNEALYKYDQPLLGF